MSLLPGIRVDLEIGYRCANGGISDTVDHVTVTRFMGVPVSELALAGIELTPATPDAPEVHIVRGNLRDTLKAIDPAQAEQSARKIGPMMGGNHLPAIPGLTSQPTPLHDRYETPAEYAALSR